MFRRAIIMLSLCFATLCAFVGYLSYQATLKVEEVESVQEMTPCDSFIENPPVETTRVLLGEYRIGKRIASLDFDDDGKWDHICVPFFPNKLKGKFGYQATLICFDDVPDEAAFRAIATQGKVDASFLPGRKVNSNLHSQLAMKYKHLDFAHSPLLFYGVNATNPLLGEATMKGSIVAGAIALLVAFLALISGLLKFRISTNRRDLDDEYDDDQPTTNRAGLPVAAAD